VNTKLQALTSCPALRCFSVNDSTDPAGMTLSAELYIYNCGQLGCPDDNKLSTSESLLQCNNEKLYKLPVMENLSMVIMIRITLLSIYQRMVSDVSFFGERV
jgi:hypothetical protein